MEKLRIIKRFLSTSAMLVMGGIFTAVGIGLEILALVENGSIMGVGFILILPIGLIFLAIELKRRISFNNWLKSVEQTNQLEAVMSDFENGAAFFAGLLRMGTAYIFMERMGGVYEYGDIQEVSLRSVIASNRTIRNELRFKTVKGKKPFVGGSMTLEDVENEYAAIVQLLRAHNPNVAVKDHKTTYN